jgi:hypothetical protein
MNSKRLAISAGSVVAAIAIVAVAIVGFTSVPQTVAEVKPAAHTPTAAAPVAPTPDAPSSTPSPEPGVSTAAPAPAPPAIGPSGNAMSAEWISWLQAGISSGNTAALEQLLAARVHIVTTEGVDKTVLASAAPDAITAGIDDSAVDTTWDWSLDAASLATYRAGPYGQYFPTDGVIGISSKGVVLAYTVVGSGVTAMLISRHVAALR